LTTETPADLVEEATIARITLLRNRLDQVRRELEHNARPEQSGSEPSRSGQTCD